MSNELSQLSRMELEAHYIIIVKALLDITKYDEYAAFVAPKLAESALLSVGIQLPTDWNKRK